jgi:DNA-binding transcriptional LysR family regulator
MLPKISAKMQAMDWDDLRYILAVSRAGTLAAAARRLSVNQTTVARRLGAAEANFGSRLFERRDGALQPTRAGQAAISQAARIEQEVDVLKQGARDVEAAGSVRLTAVPVLVHRLLAPSLPAFCASHPRLRLELMAEVRNLSLTRREADIALRLARPEGAGLPLTRRLGHLAYAVYGPRRPGAKRLPWITYEEAFAHLPQARWIANQQREAIAPVLAGDTETVLHLVRAGLGKSLLPRFAADSDPHLACLSGTNAVLTRELWLLTHRELRHTARIAAVIDWLAALTKTHLA